MAATMEGAYFEPPRKKGHPMNLRPRFKGNRYVDTLPDIDQQLENAINMGDVAWCQECVKKGANVNCRVSAKGYTPLMLAVHAKDPWSVNELLLAGARKDARGLDQKMAQTLLQELSATNDWDPTMVTLASLLEPDATGVQRPQGSSASK